MAEHTPTPWQADMRKLPDDIGGDEYLRSYVGPDGQTIRLVGFALAGGNSANGEPNANAAHIVKCVNSFDELVTALEVARSYVVGTIHLKVDIETIDAALAKAGALK